MHSQHLLISDLSEIANLHVADTENGLMDRLPGFGAFGEEPPPPPKLDERGVVAMDITEEFKAAAESMFDSLLLVYRIFGRSRVNWL